MRRRRLIAEAEFYARVFYESVMEREDVPD
jgi:hypothetical protein